MLAGRRIAAAHVTAGEADPQLNPSLPQRETLFTALGPRIDRPGF